MTAKQFIKLLKADGWYFVRQEGSHKQFRHLVRTGRVTVSDHGGKNIAPGTLDNMRKQAGWK